MHQALAHAASSNGHTYMSWDQLQPDALRLMSASGEHSIAYLPHVSATSQLGYTQLLPHKCVMAFDVCIELPGVECQRQTNVLVVTVKWC